MRPDADTAVGRPASLGELFLAFAGLALRGFGGVLPWAHRVLVEERRWMAPRDFTEMIGLATLLPGPNIVNLGVMLGDRWFGWRGSLAALAGLLLPPLALVMGAAIVYARWADHPAVRAGLQGMAAVAAGLIIATALRMARPIARERLAAAFALAAFVGVGVARWPLPWVLAALAPVSLAAYWRRLRAQARLQAQARPQAEANDGEDGRPDGDAR